MESRVEVFQESKGLIEPFDFHLYIGGAFDYSWRIQEFAVKLRKMGYRVCLKYDLEFPENNVLSNILDGISNSYRCILLQTNSFRNDKFATKEINRLTTKVERFGRQVVLLLNINKSEKESYQDKFIEEMLDDDFIDNEFDVNRLVRYLFEDKPVNLTSLTKLNLSFGTAFGYFYGFLKLVLPEMKDKLFHHTLGGNTEMINAAVSKLLIIIPEDCKGRISIEIETKIKSYGFVVTAAERAGTKQRDYKSSVYTIFDEGKEYYFVGEIATPIVTMYETYYGGLLGLTLEELYEERNIFFTVLKSILNHELNNVRDKYRLIYWRNLGNNSDESFYNLLLKVVKEEIYLKETGGKYKEEHPNSLISEDKNLFRLISVDTSNPKAIYDDISCYSLRFKFRGICIAFVFNKCSNLPLRNGWEKEKEYIHKTFTNLEYKVVMCVDYTLDEVEKVLEYYESFDYTDYGVLACCISSHGNLGYIHTTDSQKSILSFTNHFSDENCPSLKNKPKLFFVNCCQLDIETKDAFTQYLGTEIENDATKVSGTEIENDVTKVSGTKTKETNNHETERFKHSPKCALTPRYPDFLISYSCLPGRISYRFCKAGSPYLLALKDFLKINKEIRSCLDEVSDKVTELLGRKLTEQKQFHVCSLTKPLYL